MSEAKRWPAPGDLLTHRWRKQSGEVTAEVLSVDLDTGGVVVRVGEVVYPSLSAAATAQSGHATNGWVFWGLKR